MLTSQRTVATEQAAGSCFVAAFWKRKASAAGVVLLLFALLANPSFAYAGDGGIVLPVEGCPGISLEYTWVLAESQAGDDGDVSTTYENIGTVDAAKTALNSYGREHVWASVVGSQIDSNFDGQLTIPSTISIDDAVFDVRRINWDAFRRSDPVVSLHIPGSIETLGEWTFYKLANLESVSIDEGVRDIDGAFYGCASLRELTLPSTLENMSGAFEGCISLTEAEIPSKVVGSSQAFADCAGIKKAKIARGVTRVDGLTFSGCTSLAEVELPETIEEIDSYAFSDCASLASITLPDSVRAIQKGAFEGCPSLRSIAVPGSVKYIDDFAFDSGITVRCAKDSYAHIWAKTHAAAFSFSPKPSIADASVILSQSSYAYDGAEHKPSVQAVILGDTVLQKNIDYEVSYPSDCTAAGAKTVTVRGVGNYTDETTGNFEIVAYTKGEKGDKGDKGDTGPAGPAGASGSGGGGAQGPAGPAGNGISKVEKTGSARLVDTYTIYFTDGTTSTFTVTNGKDGKDGENGKDGRSTAVSEPTGTDVDVQTRVNGVWVQYRVGNGGKWTNLVEVPDSYGTEFTSGSGDLEFEVTGNVSVALVKSSAAKFSMATVKHGYSTYKIDEIADGAFAGSNVKSVTLSKHVERIGKKAFSGCKSLKTLVVKSTKLTKAKVKRCLAGSSVKTVKVPRSKLKAYRKIFTKANCGKKVNVVGLA